MRFKGIFVGIVALGVLLAGCAVPALEPFAVATVELRRAVVESGAVTAEAMAVAGGDAAAGEFVEIWEDRVRLMDVLLGYSDALAGVAAAGSDAGRTAGALGDSIMRLADLVPGTGAAAGSGVQLGQILVRTGIQIQAHHDLGRAVGAAHPALVEVAKYLEADLEDLRRLYEKASQDREGALDDEFGQREFQRGKLLKRRDLLRAALVGSFSDADVEQVKRMGELLAQAEGEHREYVGRRAGLLRERTLTLRMFQKAKRGVRAWVRAHGELRLAIAQNRRPNVRLVLSAAWEIRAAVDRLRAH